MPHGSSSVEVAEGDHLSLIGLRRWMRKRTPHCDGALDSGMVLTELVGNAIEHGGGLRRARITITHRHVLVEVTDHEPDTILTVGRSRLDRHRGWGLIIVDATATWGLTREADRKVVWARIPIGASPELQE